MDLVVFFIAWLLNGGFVDRVPATKLTSVGWISILSATIYMAWMALYYVSNISLRSDLEKEAERHRETAVRLRAAKEHAESANRSRSILLAKMSQAFRTSLNAVIGYSELLYENESDAGAEPRKLRDLERINAAGRELLDQVVGVLDAPRTAPNAADV